MRAAVVTDIRRWETAGWKHKRKKGAKWWGDEDEGRRLDFKLVQITSMMAIWCSSNSAATQVYFVPALDWKVPSRKSEKSARKRKKKLAFCDWPAFQIAQLRLNQPCFEALLTIRSSSLKLLAHCQQDLITSSRWSNQSVNRD